MELNNKEKRALEALLWCNPCNAGCIYPEMEKSRKDCNECELTESINSIRRKLEEYNE